VTSIKRPQNGADLEPPLDTTRPFMDDKQLSISVGLSGVARADEHPFISGEVGNREDLRLSEWPGQDSNLRATDYETQVFPAYNVFAVSVQLVRGT